ncbi:MAG: hypothetical protein FJW31_00560 [Acidobacteria bacterium]|nr:hypothetical protein [Acidobacteriota bacterium]
MWTRLGAVLPPGNSRAFDIKRGTPSQIFDGAGGTDGFKVVFDDQELDGLEIAAAPGTVGVGRAKFALPEGTALGSHTVRILIGEAASNTVQFAVPE